MIGLRPLTTGELLDRTFSLYRIHFGLFFAIFAVPHLILFAYQCVGLIFVSPVPRYPDAALSMLWNIGAWILSLVLSAASQAATVIAVSNVYLERPAGVRDSFSRIKGEILGVVGLSLLIAIAAVAGMLLLVVPGVLLLITWSLAVPSKVLENRGVLDSMSRSSDLAKGDWGRIFVVWLLFFILGIAVSMLLRWPVQLAAGVKSIFAMQRTARVWQAALLASTFISQCLVGPLGTIAFSLLYYDERVRKEAFDLQLMMTSLDAPSLAGSPAQAGA